MTLKKVRRVEQIVFHEQWDLCFSPPKRMPPPAINQVYEDQSQPPTDMPTPLMCHPRVVYGAWWWRQRRTLAFGTKSLVHKSSLILHRKFKMGCWLSLPSFFPHYITFPSPFGCNVTNCSPRKVKLSVSKHLEQDLGNHWSGVLLPRFHFWLVTVPFYGPKSYSCFQTDSWSKKRSKLCGVTFHFSTKGDVHHFWALKVL